MKYFIFLFFIITIITGEVMAVGFSPNSLIFELKTGEKKCQMIKINSNSELITMSDKWAENRDVEWRVSEFDKDADYHSLSVTYPKTLNTNQRNAEICLSGKEQGEYHGVVLLTEKQKGNLVAQMGVWMKATIGNGINESEEEKGIVFKETLLNNNNSQTEKNNLEVIEEKSKDKITAGAISKGEKIADKRIFWIIGILIISLMLIAVKLCNKKGETSYETKL